ncbi:Retrovirus-related Pol polyprotein from transposon 412 [Mytilus edulis]|uniref:Retrovirus-related Pol polyprotein from transposon 412 n=1 Tax=Mytilus edulis TaxID=6550 RepID=A0A8S3V629_MYTED|nr:Retrovirus-related Pol polyprotein from transposon 412 [Mytilus edulis]
MANYYRRFIKDYSKIVCPLTALTHKNQPVKLKWTPKCQTAFESIKQALITAPVLAYPDLSKPFILTCDASDEAISFVLGQSDFENKEYVVAYGNKTLTKEEKRYNTSEKECLAILKGVETYRPYLANSHFTVVTDHSALVWLKSAKHTGRLARWALRMQDLQFSIIHRPGKSNVVADCLSRIPNPFNTDSVQAISLSKDILSESSDDTESLSEPLESEDVLSDAEEFDECKPKWRTEVKLIYEFDHVDDGHESPMVAAIEVQNVQETIDDKVSLSQLQKECPDFTAIYTYLSLGELPDDRKLRDKVVSESKYFSLSDGVLNHWYQRRCRGLAEEFKRIKQIALPKCLRLDA